MNIQRTGFTKFKTKDILLTGIRQGNNVMGVFHYNISDLEGIYDLFDFYTGDVHKCFYVKIPTMMLPVDFSNSKSMNDLYKEIVLFTLKNQTDANKLFESKFDEFLALDVHGEMNITKQTSI